MSESRIEFEAAHPAASVLIVDDNPANIKFLEAVLGLAGYTRIHSLTDSTRAPEVYQQLKPDVVLLDLKMPGLDGFQVLELFKQTDQSGFVPVLMLTSEESKTIKLKALNLGVKDFLTKPFDRLEVLVRINNLIETHLLYKSLQDKNRDLDEVVKERTAELKREVTVRQQAEEHIRHQALHDGLTGLPNRSLLKDRLQQDIYNAERSNRFVSVLLLDIDRFREINNTLGHRNGDTLLAEIAKRLQVSLRLGDTIARYERQTGPETVARIGGDAFTVVLPMLPSVDTNQEIISRVRDVFSRPFELDGFLLEVNARVTIANYPEHGNNAEQLLQRADVAMYHAKHTGQDYLVYSHELDTFSTFRLTLMSELRQAIVNNGLELHYQPKIDIEKNQIIGFEALVRWVHDSHGFIPPDQFIPMAEETGMIKMLSNWVLESVITQCHRFSDMGIPCHISANLSAHDLLDDQLIHNLSHILKETGIEPGNLTLEVTESAMMNDPDTAMDVITRVSKLGVNFSIDDFGTGYSSLSYLKKLPVDEIKIDKSFVMDMTNNPDDVVIVRSTIDLAHNLGRRVVAEGIENRETLHALRDLGCDYAQGFYLGRPLPADKLHSWLDQHSTAEWL